jgi:hypothetical protein
MSPQFYTVVKRHARTDALPLLQFCLLVTFRPQRLIMYKRAGFLSSGVSSHSRARPIDDTFSRQNTITIFYFVYHFSFFTNYQQRPIRVR